MSDIPGEVIKTAERALEDAKIALHNHGLLHAAANGGDLGDIELIVRGPDLKCSDGVSLKTLLAQNGHVARAALLEPLVNYFGLRYHERLAKAKSEIDRLTPPDRPAEKASQ